MAEKKPWELKKQDFLEMTEMDIRELTGPALVAASVELCGVAVRWNDRSKWWVDAEGAWFEPDSDLRDARMVQETMMERGWGPWDIHLNQESGCSCTTYPLGVRLGELKNVNVVSVVGLDEASARTRASVLAAWRDEQVLRREERNG